MENRTVLSESYNIQYYIYYTGWRTELFCQNHVPRNNLSLAGWLLPILHTARNIINTRDPYLIFTIKETISRDFRVSICLNIKAQLPSSVINQKDFENVVQIAKP